MGEEQVKSKLRQAGNNKSFSASRHTFDLPLIIEEMKHSDSWENGDLNVKILIQNGDKQIVLTALHEGTEIKSFHSPAPVTFLVIEGKLKLHNRKDSVVLDKGQLLVLKENHKYCLTTNEETVFLLTFSNEIIQPAET